MKIQVISSFLLKSLFVIFCAIILSLSLRGLPGNPTVQDLNQNVWKDDGPFELSPERGRFAVIYALVENNSFQFTRELGEFAKPDVALLDGGYVSLFAPGPSYIALPGYLIGKYYGASQVGSFAVIAIFALLNLILLKSIATKLGAHPLAATIASGVFLFGTPAFTYAVDLYQHHISTFLILFSIWVLLRLNTYISLLVVFFLCGISIMIDNPNLFFMFPIGFFAVWKAFTIRTDNSKYTLNIDFLKLLTGVIVIIPLLIFGWSNYKSYGDPFQLAGTLKTSEDLKIRNSPIEEATSAAVLQAQATASRPEDVEKEAVNFFKTRAMLNGFYIHFISPDRGMYMYTPVMFLGFIGMIVAYQKKVQLYALMIAIMGANILLYTMWGDPWGGWAFGSRYLIPTYAILSIFLALLLTYWRKNLFFLIIFGLLFGYSIAVNSLGAITSSRNPPQAEVLNLEKITGREQKYTPQRNLDMIYNNQSKSFIFQTFANKYFTALDYYLLISLSIGSVFLTLLIIYYLSSFKYHARLPRFKGPKIEFRKFSFGGKK